MTQSSTDRLYSLLPTFYVQDDAAHGQPLRALMAVLQSMLDELHDNAEELYDDWFIETCSQWVVPYIGELLGVHGLSDAAGNTPGQRARVANTLTYRRRKGTPLALQRAIQDATDWWVHVRSFAQLLVRAQNVKHVTDGYGGTVDVRDVEALRNLEGPYESIAHRVDVRQKYKPSEVGVFVWRLASYTVDYEGPSSHTGPFAGDYTLDPFGMGVPLFDTPPRMVTRTDFAADLAAFRRQHAAQPNPPPNSRYYGPHRALRIVRDGRAVSPLAVMGASLDWSDEHETTVEWPDAEPPIQLAIDVELGRMLFRTPPSNAVEVHFTYGFSGDVGGGPYDRTSSLSQDAAYDLDVCVALDGGCEYASLSAALEAWNTLVERMPTARGRIRLNGSGIFRLGSAAVVSLPWRGGLTIEASNHGVAYVAGDLTVRGRNSWLGDESARTLTINGLIINGAVHLERAMSFRLLHTTLLPIGESLTWTTDNSLPELDSLSLDVYVERSVLGAVRLPRTSKGLSLVDSIVDGMQAPAGFAIAAAAEPGQNTPGLGPPTSIAGATLLGQVAVRELRDARSTIFLDPVHVQETQVGGISCSFVPSGSTTPRRFRCQPDLALQSRSASTDPLIVLDRVRPLFSSTVYGLPDYCQLSATCPLEISRGGEGGSEMGSFWFLHNPEREANLSAVLDEYLNVGLTPRIVYVT